MLNIIRNKDNKIHKFMGDKMKKYKARNGQMVGFEHVPKWIRVLFDNRFIADSKKAKLFLPGAVPYYYFSKQDVEMDMLKTTNKSKESKLLGEAVIYDIKSGEKIAKEAAWNYPEPVSDDLDISDYISFDWQQMDGWFEEAEEIFVHPHNPYHRIDILQSTRHVKVVIMDEVIAETNAPVLLFETGLPTRYYFPKLDVRSKYLQKSKLKTGCAYKGWASYYTVKIGNQEAKNVCWHYDFPASEMSKIATLIAFFNERVDIYVDGLLQEKPRTLWS